MIDRFLCGVLTLLVCSMPAPVRAQTPSPCTRPPLPPASKETNIFTPEQAAILGDVVMQQVARRFQLVRDPALNAYAQQIGDRMAEFAGTGAIRVELLDLPEVNAMAYPGGRILLSRKLVAFDVAKRQAFTLPGASGLGLGARSPSSASTGSWASTWTSQTTRASSRSPRATSSPS